MGMLALKAMAVAGVVLFVYSYLLYPILLSLLAGWVQLKRDIRHVTGKVNRRATAPSVFPHIGVVIAAFNEEKHIRQRVENLLNQDYPADKLRIYIGSDGSKDQTGAILKAFDDERLQAFVFEQNRGKASVLNDLVSRGQEELIAFSDANTFFAPDALRKLVAPFSDPNVGGVSGELRLLSGQGNNQDGIYWKIEQLLKFFESRIGGLLGANGAIYAIRRSLWRPIRPDTICDDFCVAMNVAAQGAKLVYEPSAWAEEEMPDNIDDEYHRRIRIGIGNFQALFRQPEYFTRTTWGTRFAYLSHKVLRWLAPHLILGSLAASIAVVLFEPNAQAWQAWLAVQAIGLIAAAIAYRLTQTTECLPGPIKLFGFVFALNWAFLVASWRYMTGQYSGSWRRTVR